MFKQLSQAEIDDLLRVERIMRVGFDANDERYLVPLGFVCHRGVLYAMTTQGRKTQMAAANPKVLFRSTRQCAPARLVGTAFPVRARSRSSQTRKKSS
jgi:nitroimidazol reductase NimA-like FMN-containing flavoprotein (pyridoxamine 5'-phosphate oxidase superfamily)